MSVDLGHGTGVHMTGIRTNSAEAGAARPRTSDPLLSAIELARVVELLAPALSHGRRRKGQLVTGRSRAFFTSKGCTRVYVPFPLPTVETEGVSAARLATCGLALQACPTKEALAELPLADLRPAELAALSQVEGEAPWPGPSRTFRGSSAISARIADARPMTRSRKSVM